MNIKLGLIVGVLVVGGAFSLVIFSDRGEDQQAVTVQEGEQKEESKELSIPLDLPANVPMYPGSALQSSQDTLQDGVRNIVLSLGTKDSVADVNTWYRGALGDNGWVVTSDKNVGGYVLLKGENENIVVFMQAANRSDLGMVVITQRIQIK